MLLVPTTQEPVAILAQDGLVRALVARPYARCAARELRRRLGRWVDGVNELGQLVSLNRNYVSDRSNGRCAVAAKVPEIAGDSLVSGNRVKQNELPPLLSV